jgi:UTP--glucose-1-phosphate uridylyltransferase
MFPLDGKPLIQYAVEEAAASGIKTVILVIRENKSAVQDHFKRDSKLESLLKSHGKAKEATLVRRLSEIVEIRTIQQDVPQGLAHAVACARPLVDGETFAVLLPDVIIDSPEPCTRQLIDAYTEYPASIIAIREIRRQELRRYGVVRVRGNGHQDSANGRLLRAVSLVEKPAMERGPVHFGIFGRYVLGPEIFEYLQRLRFAKDGEIQLTEGLDRLCRQRPVYGFRFDGTHYDVGDRLGFLKASVGLALKNPKLHRPMQEFLAQLQLTN